MKLDKKISASTTMSDSIYKLNKYSTGSKRSSQKYSTKNKGYRLLRRKISLNRLPEYDANDQEDRSQEQRPELEPPWEQEAGYIRRSRTAGGSPKPYKQYRREYSDLTIYYQCKEKHQFDYFTLLRRLNYADCVRTHTHTHKEF